MTEDSDFGFWNAFLESLWQSRDVDELRQILENIRNSEQVSSNQKNSIGEAISFLGHRGIRVYSMELGREIVKVLDFNETKKYLYKRLKKWGNLPDRWVVIIPICGLILNSVKKKIGDVELYDPKAFVDELTSTLRDTTVFEEELKWARARIVVSTSDSNTAERIGRQTIEKLIALLSFRVGTSKPFWVHDRSWGISRRDWALSLTNPSEATFVAPERDIGARFGYGAKAYKRRLEITYENYLILEELEKVFASYRDLSPTSQNRVDLMLRWLARFKSEEDSVSALLSLWIDLEIMSSPASMPRILLEVERRQVKKALRSIACINKQKIERLIRYISEINRYGYSAVDRIRKYVSDIGLPTSTTQLAALKTCNQWRNAIVHQGSYAIPSIDWPIEPSEITMIRELLESVVFRELAITTD